VVLDLKAYWKAIPPVQAVHARGMLLEGGFIWVLMGDFERI